MAANSRCMSWMAEAAAGVWRGKSRRSLSVAAVTSREDMPKSASSLLGVFECRMTASGPMSALTRAIASGIFFALYLLTLIPLSHPTLFFVTRLIAGVVQS